MWLASTNLSFVGVYVVSSLHIPSVALQFCQDAVVVSVYIADFLIMLENLKSLDCHDDMRTSSFGEVDSDQSEVSGRWVWICTDSSTVILTRASSKMTRVNDYSMHPGTGDDCRVAS